MELSAKLIGTSPCEEKISYFLYGVVFYLTRPVDSIKINSSKRSADTSNFYNYSDKRRRRGAFLKCATEKCQRFGAKDSIDAFIVLRQRLNSLLLLFIWYTLHHTENCWLNENFIFALVKLYKHFFSWTLGKCKRKCNVPVIKVIYLILVFGNFSSLYFEKRVLRVKVIFPIVYLV